MQVPPAYVGSCGQWRKYYGNNMSIVFCSGALAVPFLLALNFIITLGSVSLSLAILSLLSRVSYKIFLLWNGDLMLRDSQCMQ